MYFVEVGVGLYWYSILFYVFEFYFNVFYFDYILFVGLGSIIEVKSYDVLIVNFLCKCS